VGVLLLSGCAYFNPARSESQHLQEQAETQKQQEFRNSLEGELIEEGVRGSVRGLKAANGQ
jgi:hypothetical protein